MSQPVGDEYSVDGSEEAEAAHDIGLSFYEDISKMYQATLNLFSAGLFHVIEQQLADLNLRFLDQIDRNHLLRYVKFLREHDSDLDDRTVHNIFERQRRRIGGSSGTCEQQQPGAVCIVRPRSDRLTWVEPASALFR